MTHDRTGEVVDLDAPARKPHDPRCRGGWIGTDDDGRPIPCRQCKPHLAVTSRVNDCAPDAR